MIIKNIDNKTEYICSICGHMHTTYDDGKTTNEPFVKHDKKINIPEEIMEQTNAGLRTGSIMKSYDAYTCPKCNKLQINVLDLYSN